MLPWTLLLLLVEASRAHKPEVVGFLDVHPAIEVPLLKLRALSPAAPASALPGMPQLG
jgi:hypothetical protein